MRQGILLAVLLLLTSPGTVQAQMPPDWGAVQDVAQVPAPQRMSSKVFSNDGRMIATVRAEAGKREGALQLWNANTGSLVWSAKEPVNGVLAFSPDDKTLAGTAADYNYGFVGRCHRQTAPVRCYARSSGPGGEIDAVAFSPNGKLIAIGGSGVGPDTTIELSNPGWNAPGYYQHCGCRDGKTTPSAAGGPGRFHVRGVLT